MQKGFHDSGTVRGNLVPRRTEGEKNESGCITVDLSTIGITPNTRTFAVKMLGDSMTGANIVDGDTIVLEMKPAGNGAIVAALVDGECMVRRYVLQRGAPYLRAENPKYQAVIPASELVIQGVMIGLFRKT